MRKGPIYIVAAAIIGILLVLVPLTIIRAENESTGEFLFNAERSYDTNATQWASELQFLTITFVLVLVIYLFLRRRVPHGSTARTLHYPF